jgi:spore coat protein CotH
VLLLALGGIRLSAGGTSSGGHPRWGDIAGTVDLFDESAVHTIEVTFDDPEYEAAIEEFTETGDKDFIEADVVIDGTTIQDVGIRLKGNSTLFGASPGAEVPAGRGEKAVPAGTVDLEGPEGLPWLISFGEFVEGQTYQGHDAIAVRPAGLQGAMTTALNEALSLSLIAATGEPAEKASYAAFSANGSAATLRLVVQEPGDSLVEEDFSGEGILYKALSGGSFDCRGDDPLDYEDSFRRVTGEDQAGLEPLVEFVCWVEESSDEEFAAGLADRADVASLARYLALHNLLLDFDDMTGPGQNYYLFYDIDEQRFTVVSWDLNLSWSGDPGRGPFETGSLAVGGGPARPQDGAIPGGGVPTRGGEGTEGAAGPGAAAPPAGMNPPGDMPRPQAGQGAPGVTGGNLLAERFLEVDGFRALYEEAYGALYRQLFADGTALEVLDGWAGTLAGGAGELIGVATLEGEVSTLRDLITARTTALAAEGVVSG